MSLFRRNQQIQLGNHQAQASTNSRGLSMLLETDPLSTNYKSPLHREDVKQIYNWYIAQQIQRYGAIVGLPESVSKRHIKLALQEHTVGYICRAIKFGTWVSNHPFSIPFAVKALLSYENQSQPTQPQPNQRTGLVTSHPKALWD